MPAAATPVLFFGTAEFSWIDAARNVSPWETENSSRRRKDSSAEFEWVRPARSHPHKLFDAASLSLLLMEHPCWAMRHGPWVPGVRSRDDGSNRRATVQALREAEEYADESRLPASFEPDAPPPFEPVPMPAGSPTAADLAAAAPLLSSEETALPAAAQRRLTAARRLGLAAPCGSAFAHKLAPNPALVALAAPADVDSDATA